MLPHSILVWRINDGPVFYQLFCLKKILICFVEIGRVICASLTNKGLNDRYRYQKLYVREKAFLCLRMLTFL